MPKIKIKIKKRKEDWGSKLEGSDAKIKMAPMSKHIKLSSPKRKMTIYGKGKMPAKAKEEVGEGVTTYRGMSKERLEAREAKRLGMSMEEYQARKKRHLRLKRK